MESLLLEKRKALNSSSSTDLPQLTKLIRRLEYSLEQKKQNLNKLLDEIKTQKDDINTLRRDRVIFDNVFKELEREIMLKEHGFKAVLYEHAQVLQEKNLAEEELYKIKGEAEREMLYFSKEYDRAFADTQMGSKTIESQNFKEKEPLAIVLYI